MKQVLLGIIFVSALLTGCVTAAAVNTATPDQDADAKRFSPAAGSANFYIARNTGSTENAAAFKLVVDDKDCGLLYPGTYQMVALAPGRHKIALKAGLQSAYEQVAVEAGKNYFYSAGTKTGDSAGQPELSYVLFEKMGKLMISQSKRAAVQN